MGKLNQIQAKLLELDAGTFQRLCDDWLHRKGYKNLNCIGTKPATNKSIKGTPDSLLIKPDGNYIFAEYTVQQDKVASKIKDDLQKCLDITKTQIATENISEIIVCYLGKLTSKEINELKQTCNDKGIKLTLNGIDTIAYSIKNDFPSLANEYLSLQLDTGQLLLIDDFINCSQKLPLSTPIDNQILFRDAELLLAEQKLMRSNLLLITGPSGIGKTLFGINVLKRLCEKDQNLKAYCVFNKGVEIYQDITSYFSEPGHYLIFIDDANRLDNRLDYILNYLNEIDSRRSFRIIATIRDYSKSHILDKAKHYTMEPCVIGIEKLTDDQIKTLVSDLFDVKNAQYQQRIQEIAQGNPRLAVMASILAIEEQNLSSLYDVTSLYNEFFKRNENVMIVLENTKLLITACAISFFRTVDKTNEEQISYIQTTFEIQPELFWECANELHKKEIVDMYENEVVKFSDQVLSTYMFFIALFDKKLISFSSLMRSFYPQFKRKIIDAINPVIRMFDQNKILSEIKKELKTTFEELKRNNLDADIIEFLNSFWFVLPTESLSYANQFVPSIKPAHIEWNKENFEKTKHSLKDSSIVDLLSNFRHYKKEEFNTSLELLLLLLEKKKEYLGDVIKVLIEKYNFDYDDWKSKYYIQEHIIDFILDKMNGINSYLYTRLFILIAKEFLKVEFHNTQWTSGKTVNIRRFKLTPNENIIRIRKKIIEHLSSLLIIEQYTLLAQEVFHEYVSNLKFLGRDMAQSDMPFIKKYLVPNLNKLMLSQCILMQDLRENYELLGIKTPSKWRGDFKNDVLYLYNFLLEDRHEKALLEMSNDEYKFHRYNTLSKHFEKNFKPSDFYGFMQKCVEIKSAIQGQRREYAFNQGIELCLNVLSDLYPDKFYEFMSIYIDFDPYFELYPEVLVQNLLKNNSSEKIWELINQEDFNSKERWISLFFSLLSDELITSETTKNLLSHYNKSSYQYLIRNMEYLDKYISVDKEIFVKVTQILLERTSIDRRFAKPFESLFDGNSIKLESIFVYFSGNESLIYQSYIAALKLDYLFDYSGKALDYLTTQNKEFVKEFIDCIFEIARESTFDPDLPELTFIWERQNFIKEAEEITQHLYKMGSKTPYVRDKIFKKLLQINSIPINSRKEIENKIHTFIKNTITENCMNAQYVYFILDAISNMDLYIKSEFILELFKIFLDQNHNLKDFKLVMSTQMIMSWEGSKVPVLEKEKEVLKNILPLLDSIYLLDHKLFIEQNIENIEGSIALEKKRDILQE